MRSKEFVIESAKLWSAKVRVSQPNYVGYVDAQVWAPNAQIARTILKQQYQIQDHHVGSVKEIRMKANEIIKEANYDQADFNPRIESARIQNLKIERSTATFDRKKEIDKEIREIENQLRLYGATLPPEPAKVPVEPDEGGPYMLYTDVVQAGQFGGRTLKGAKNSVQRAMMQQQAHVYAIATDNKNKIVAVWYPTDKENKYNIGDIYRPPGSTSYDQYNDQPRYPPGHPYAGAVMPPKIPVVTDWSQLPDGGLAAWMQGGQNPEAGATVQQKPERYMGQAQRVDSQQGLPQPRKRK
jgi:hypothetical protein